MICPKCGNQVSPEEAFCGQCGTPVTPSVPRARPTEAANSSVPRSGLLSSYNTPGMSPPPGSYNSGTLPPPNTYNPASPPPTNSSFIANQPTQTPGPPAQRQQSDFYQDATEAISALPPGANQGFPQPGFPASGAYAPPQQPPFQSGNYAGPGYSPSQPFLSGQGYGMPPRPAPPPEKHRGNTILVVASICLVVALIAVVGLGALYFTRSQHAAATPTPAATTAPTAAPTPSPTAVPTPSPTAVPTPTTPPTPAPNPGFAWCDQTCRNNGYSVQYPTGWTQGTTADSTGVQFTSPTSQEIFANFKTPGPANQTADQLVNNDLQALNPKPTDISPTTTTTIGGTTWTSAIAHYQPASQVDRIQVYATVYQGKAYIIELQAPDPQFDAINNQYFVTMLATFQFVQNAH